MLTVEQVAKRLGCSTNHARRLVRSGVISPVSIGLPNAKRRTIRIAESELIRYIEHDDRAADTSPSTVAET